ncbi:MAG: hypothetical protein K6E29_09585 [Cyanobacteria bacterium RUI128]|nr:hypothetical protein [Cyanobacteria bacterium RUI128]
MIGKVLGLSQDQVNAAKYAIKMRRQGYHLLRNPKGTPNTEVNLIEVRQGITLDDYHDSRTFIDRIRATFSNGEKHEDSRILTSMRFRDPETKELGTKRNVEYYRFDEATDKGTEKCRFDISEADLKKRKKPNWQKGFMYDEYYADYFNKETLQNPARAPYFTKPGEKVIVPILTFGLIRPKGPTRPNFFRVLWDNLHNKG